MGCGKSSIGRTVQHLATASPLADTDSGSAVSENMIFVDLDEEIVRRCGQSIPEIFSATGEAGFRAIERETLADILSGWGVLPPQEFASLTPPSAGADSSPAIEPRVLRPSGAIAPTASNQTILLSLGGGTLMSDESREMVRKNCKCIYLRAGVETLAANLREDGAAAGRPMLAGANPDAPTYAPDSLESRISAMMAVRGPIYEKAADIILDIDGLDYTDVARKIRLMLQS
jgi:shikimate kinase